MLSKPSRIRPSQPLLTHSPPRFGYAPSSRPVLLSQRPGFTTRASLFCHHQNPITASFPKKIIASTQERRSSYNNAATAVEDVEDLSENENKKEDKELKWDFIKKVYNNLAAQFLFTGLVLAVFKMAGHTPNPALASSGSSDLLFFLGMVYSIHDPKWKSINSCFLGLYSMATTVLLGTDLANLNGKAMLAAGTVTLTIVALLTKLTFWEPEKKCKVLKYLLGLIAIALPVQIIFGFIKMCTPSPIYSAIVHGIYVILTARFVLNQSEKLLNVSDEKVAGFNSDEYTVASVQLFMFIAHLFWSLMTAIKAVQVLMV